MIRPAEIYASSHAAIRFTLAENDPAAANDLGALRRLRNAADYDIDATLDRDDAVFAVELAARLCELDS